MKGSDLHLEARGRTPEHNRRFWTRLFDDLSIWTGLLMLKLYFEANCFLNILEFFNLEGQNGHKSSRNLSPKSSLLGNTITLIFLSLFRCFLGKVLKIMTEFIGDSPFRRFVVFVGNRSNLLDLKFCLNKNSICLYNHGKWQINFSLQCLWLISLLD